MPEPLIRPAGLEDVPAILELEKRAWGKESAASKEMVEARIHAFPEGNTIAIVKREAVGLLCTLLVKDYCLDNTFRTWTEATGNGYARGRHVPDGETVYGVNLSVLPSYREHNIGRMLVKHGIEHLVVGAKRPHTVLGGRMSMYHKYADQMDAETYLKKVISGELHDPSINFFLGLEYQGVHYRAVRTLPDYFPDPESRNFGVLLIWENKFL